jgi:virulence-associated protein VapD
MDKIGTDLILTGGCNYALDECYNDMFILDTTTLTWSEGPVFMNKREGHTVISVGSTILLLFGCQPVSTCYNDIQIYTY